MTGINSIGRVVRSVSGWLRDWVHVWPLLLVLVILEAPFLPFLYPSRHEPLGEVYQPLQALKFFHSHGTDFHKYGPTQNFVLAPVYGATLGYWYLTGRIGRVSSDFPYGFVDPIPQLGTLIVESRVVFLILALVSFGWLAARMRSVTPNRGAIGLATVFALATNYFVLTSVPMARPDSSMLAFGAGALGAYLLIVAQGLTATRAFWLSVFAVLAISSKENIASAFVPPYLWIAWHGWCRRGRSPAEVARHRRAVVVGLVTGVVGYGALNIVYAPRTWWQRMEFWLWGPGVSPEVWLNPTRARQLGNFLWGLALSLGPGGTVAALAAVVVVLIVRPPRLLPLTLPMLGAVLGAFQIRYVGGYVGGRFLQPAVLFFIPVLAVGLAVILESARARLGRVALALALAVSVAANLSFGGLAWVYLHTRADYLIERYVRAYVPHSRVIAKFSIWEQTGADRLDWLGYRTEGRAYQGWFTDSVSPPDIVFVNRAELKFYLDSALFPARSAMLRESAGFDFAKWRSLESLGYTCKAIIAPDPPAWILFSTLPGVRGLHSEDELLVYVRRNPRGRDR